MAFQISAPYLFHIKLFHPPHIKWSHAHIGHIRSRDSLPQSPAERRKAAHSYFCGDQHYNTYTFAGINKGAASSLDIRLYSLRSLHHRYSWCIANDAVSTNATPNKRSSVDTFMFNMARTSTPNAISSFISNSGLNSDNIG